MIMDKIYIGIDEVRDFVNEKLSFGGWVLQKDLFKAYKKWGGEMEKPNGFTRRLKIVLDEKDVKYNIQVTTYNRKTFKVIKGVSLR